MAANYRLSPKATFPDHLIDVKRALAWIREHIADFGGDPGLVCVTGGSAGGHLSSLLALTANDVTTALQRQNVQVAAGILNQPPQNQPGAFQISVQTQGRLANPDQFGQIVVKQSGDAVVRIKDVARVELAALDYGVNSYLDKSPATGLGVFQLPGSNAMATAEKIKATMENLSKSFPDGLIASPFRPRLPADFRLVAVRASDQVGHPDLLPLAVAGELGHEASGNARVLEVRRPDLHRTVFLRNAGRDPPITAAPVQHRIEQATAPPRRRVGDGDVIEVLIVPGVQQQQAGTDFDLA